MAAGHGGISGRYERWKEAAFQYAWLLATADPEHYGAVGSTGSVSAMSLTDIPLTTLDGKPTSLADYADRAVLLVNVASKCGLTPQYAASNSSPATTPTAG